MATVSDVAAFFNTTTKRLFYLLYARGRPQYHLFFIPKASGGQRRICSPPSIVAFFQEKLLSCITSCVVFKDPVHGFTTDRSVVTNAKRHLDAKLILNIDLLDFFPTFHFGRVRGVFLKKPFSFPTPVASVLAQTCCFNGMLPQGASTSPIISNLICRRLDRDLARVAKKNACRYTRYADDITFSTEAPTFPASLVAVPPTLQNVTPTLGAELLAILAKHSVVLNPSKSRMRSKSERQEVTGIIVNEKINVPRAFVRNIRSILHDCELNGLQIAIQRFLRIDKRKTRLGASPALLGHLRGKLDYLKMVRGADDLIYARLAVRAEKIAPTKGYGIPLFGRCLDHIPLFGESVWVLLGLDNMGNDLTNGTAFTLNGVGIVSARHVFEEGKKLGACRWVLRNAEHPIKEHQVTAYRADPHVDLAVLDCQAPTSASLCTESQGTQHGDKIRLVGFPKWHSIADKMSVQRAQTVQIKVVSAIQHIITDGTVLGGGSGGPILSEGGRVIGVALWDGTNPIAQNGGVSISHINYAAVASPQVV
jgi:RNA-directed DNA polymerase